MQILNVLTLSLAAVASGVVITSRDDPADTMTVSSPTTTTTTTGTTTSNPPTGPPSTVPTTPPSKCEMRPFYLEVDGVAIASPDQDPLLQNGNGHFISLFDRDNGQGTLAASPTADNIDSQRRLVATKSSKILNTFASYRSNQVFWDVEELAESDGWEPPACYIDSTGHLRCEKNRQIQWSTCFASNDTSTPDYNGDLYMTLDPAGQGTDCGGAKLKVVFVHTTSQTV